MKYQRSRIDKLYQFVLTVVLAMVGQTVAAQTPTPATARYTLQVNYGLAGNFYASSFDDTPLELQKVDFIGSAGGGELSYRLTEVSAVALGYTRSVNMAEKHFLQSFGSFGPARSDFRIRHVNNAFQAVYERMINRNPNFKYHAGLLYMTTASQSIDVAATNVGNLVFPSEINRGNSYAEEAGVVAGLEYSRQIDTKFRLGLKARAYYLLSVTSFEMLTLTPTLSYAF